MNTLLVFLISIVVLAAESQGEPSKPDQQQVLSPAVSLQEAVRLAVAHVQENKIQLGDRLLASVHLQTSSTGKLYWEIRWIPRGRFVRDGEIILRVDMDRQVTLPLLSSKAP